MRRCFDLLLTPDLVLRPADRGAGPLREPATALEEPWGITARHHGREVGTLGLRDGGLWIEIHPEQRRRGRGTQALAAWLAAARAAGDDPLLADADGPAVRALARGLGLRKVEGGWRPSARTGARLQDLQAAEDRRYRQRIHALLLELGIPGDYGQATGLPLARECRRLRSIGADIHGREQYLAPEAARAFEELRAAARADGVDLAVVSAFRGFDRQLSIIQRKRSQGQRMAEILTVSALPGYSEHHTGRALDLTSGEAEPLGEAFEGTEAFRWLQTRAAAHGFSLSYPRDNPHGIAYEPWHWCWGRGPA